MLAAALASVLTDPAVSREGWFPFAIPTLAVQETAKADLDLSFLNEVPAGKHGFVRVKGDRILDGKGRDLRLFGTNVCDFHVIPPKEQSPRIAARLAQLGFNAVRLHYYDWAAAPAGIMKPDMETVDPAMFDRMAWLIHCLIQKGIYVNINLHVARAYSGQPESGVNPMGKVVDRIVPRFLESQKNFARQILTTKSPYSGRTFAEEPGIYTIELNNENSLLQANVMSFDQIHVLPEDLIAPVRTSWNEFLRKRYSNTAILKREWGAEGKLSEKELLPRAFELEASGGAQADFSPANRGFTWTPKARGSADWNHQVHQMSVPVQSGKSYVLTFNASGTPGLEIDHRLMHQGPPWETVGGTGRVRLTSQPQAIRAGFRVSNSSGIPVRLSFSTNNQLGTVVISDLSLREGTLNPLRGTESLEKGNVGLDAGSMGGRAAKDFYDFSVSQEIGNSRMLKDYLVKTLKVKQPVLDTQVNYGGLAGLARAHQVDDIIDIHEYPAHPTAVSRDANGAFTWSVPNASLLRDVKGVLERLGQWRVYGRPFVVSEYDLNPSNQYSGESFTLFTLMAALQGWNGLNDYSWLNFQVGEESPERMFHHFSTGGNTAQLATVPFAALMFRLGLVPALPGRTTLGVPPAKLIEEPTGWGGMNALWRQSGQADSLAWTRRVGVAIRPGALEAQSQGNPGTSVAWSEGPALSVTAPGARMLLGWAGDGRARKLGDAAITMRPGTREGYGQVLVASLDGKPLASSRRALITAVSRSENVDQTWQDQAGQIVNWGKGPVVSEPVEADLVLPGGAWKIWALDRFGRKTKEVPTAGSIRLRRSDATHWWLAER